MHSFEPDLRIEKAILYCSLANGAVDSNHTTHNTTFLLESKSEHCAATHSNDEVGLKWTEEVMDRVQSDRDSGENREEIFWELLLS